MSYQSKNYNHPPVVEALCELYFTDSKWDSTLPGLFYERIKARYPRKKELQQIGVEVSISKDSQASRVRRGDARVQFATEDNSQLVQIEKDLLVVNQLRPYPRYEQWSPVVEEMLAVYFDLAKPRGIKQVGTRYINKIVIPAASFRMEDYFQFYPEIPKELSSVHGMFMMRVEIPPVNHGHNLVITFGTSMPDRPGTSAELLDIYDIYSPGTMAQANMGLVMEESHENIVTAFEHCITDSTRKLFD